MCKSLEQHMSAVRHNKAAASVVLPALKGGPSNFRAAKEDFHDGHVWVMLLYAATGYALRPCSRQCTCMWVSKPYLQGKMYTVKADEED